MKKHPVENAVQNLAAYEPLDEKTRALVWAHFPRDSVFSFDDLQACGEMILEEQGLEVSHESSVLMGARIFNWLLIHNRVIEESEKASWLDMRASLGDTHFLETL